MSYLICLPEAQISETDFIFLPLARHFLCVSVCQVNLLVVCLLHLVFLNAKLPESVTPPDEALLLRVCLSGQSSVVRICCTVFSECQIACICLSS